MKKDSVPSVSRPAYKDDDLLPITPEQTEYLRKQQNPYAKLSVAAQADTAARSTVLAEPPAPRMTVSKEEFEAECRRILGFYMPALEKGQLRPHYRAFITRNKSRAPAGRSRVLTQLRKYDLSNIPGVSPLFNREREELTESKLIAIERSAGDDE